ncbi:hypothetical protein LOZ39_006565, partial [Ophidiomyces ophidiicola]
EDLQRKGKMLITSSGLYRISTSIKLSISSTKALGCACDVDQVEMADAYNREVGRCGHGKPEEKPQLDPPSGLNRARKAVASLTMI